MIYVDFSECIPQGSITFHGGANYGIRAAKLLSEHYKLTVLVPNDEKIVELCEQEFCEYENIKINAIDSLADARFEGKDNILFIPLISTRRLSIVKKIKKNNEIKVYATIHGIRKPDLPPDKMDTWYQKENRLLYYFSYSIDYIISCNGIKYVFKKYIKEYDKIFTDSNDSMQKILRYSRPRYINMFFLGSDNIIKRRLSPGNPNKLLFVSGFRPEKNLLRVLQGFGLFIRDNNIKDIQLTITGINDDGKKLIQNCPLIEYEKIKENLRVLGYVSKEELADLYNEAGIILYPSKSEGFGLPIIEACMYEKPILSSAITAMPEILNSSGTYVNPYSPQSIADGIAKIYSNWNKEKEKIIESKQIIKSMINRSDKDFVAEFND